MAQYIPKDALVAEIERREKIHFNDYHIKLNGRPADYGACNALCQIRSFINSMEVKDVDEEPVCEDLEEEIKKYFTCNPEITLRERTFGEIARHFANWQKQKEEKELRDFYEKRNQGDASYKDLLAFKEGVEIGREEMKTQMMKEAIETDVRINVPIDDDYVYVRAYVKKELLQPRERVKVIIVKED